ncbi:MAG: RNA 3'-terminal phosphate cyclase [Candidatus Aenigmatarchaeota archaeon]
MIILDGSDAGGQFVRTACALSAITGKAIKIANIRGARPEPGLKAQHVEGIRALGELCSAEIIGLEKGSRELEFVPRKFGEKDITVNIFSAGSIGLVLQALLIAAIKFEKPVKIKFIGGGTWGKWAPPVLYLEKILFPLMGCESSLVFDIKRDGFYPKGGADVEVIVKPFKLAPIGKMEKGKLLEINIFSLASESLKKADVADRQASAAEEELRKKFSVPIIADIKYVPSVSPGSGILVVGKYEHSLLGGDSIGELGKKAEAVGKESVKNFLSEIGGAVDRHAADMLLPYMAFFGGSFATSAITRHIVTNCAVIEKFLPVKFEIDKEKNVVSVRKV